MSYSGVGPVIRVEGVSKSFGEVRALDGIDLTVGDGALFGLIGPDGAGKTTLFRILVTLMVPDEGRATVLGADVVTELWTLRRQLGYMPGRFSLYPDLTVEENLAFYASVFGTTVQDGMRVIAPIYSQLERFGDRRAGALSGGMKQKLALCCALVHSPRLLVLDEPTTGVDAVSRAEFWELLGRLRDDGLPIIVSTPYMDEATRCDRVALMQGGRLLQVDTPSALSAQYPYPLLRVRAVDRLRLLSTLRARPDAISVWPFGEWIHFTSSRRETLVELLAQQLSAELAAAGFASPAVEVVSAGVEDVFMLAMASEAAA